MTQSSHFTDFGASGRLPPSNGISTVPHIATHCSLGTATRRPSVFRQVPIRVDSRFCDTLYAVLPEHRDEWKLMTPAEVASSVDQLTSNNPVLVTLSGGNPALQPLGSVIEIGHAKGLHVCSRDTGQHAGTLVRRTRLADRQPKTAILAYDNQLECSGRVL